MDTVKEITEKVRASTGKTFVFVKYGDWFHAVTDTVNVAGIDLNLTLTIKRIPDGVTTLPHVRGSSLFTDDFRVIQEWAGWPETLEQLPIPKQAVYIGLVSYTPADVSSAAYDRGLSDGQYYATGGV